MVNSPKSLDQMSDKIRTKHYTIHTETPHTDWIKRFIRFRGKRRPKDLGAREVETLRTRCAIA